MMALYDSVCRACSALITRRYSSSFSMGIRLFAPRFRDPVYAIYGYVRLADEIVDTFYETDQAALLDVFERESEQALEQRISINPVLHSFQEVVHRYGIGQELIDAFLSSMRMDLHKDRHACQSYQEYIYGSAEVVGLMCLRVFSEGDDALFERLRQPARDLGAAFQKVNFLRDMQSDYEERGRVYFPGVDFTRFDADSKRRIEEDIQRDFDRALPGIRQLPAGVRLGVYTAYNYYLNLFQKIRKAPPHALKESRIRVGDSQKMVLLVRAALSNSLNLI